ncbi:hypothetical protein LCGC14_0591260 [marine sediment metagenome]|uniref:Uncharacterized protein n=1 Tax=marine sediment metagenome TaxID=412755 RepID=A0A0F9RIC3_9ZZZZ
MSVIHTVLTRTEVKRIGKVDQTYFRRKLQTNCMLNNLLHRPINRLLLNELICILDSKPIPRRHTEYHHHSSITVIRKVSKKEFERLWAA